MTSQYGLLLQREDILLQRKYFLEMCQMIGVRAKHRAPRKDKHYTTYAEIESNYLPEVEVPCIFNEFTDQKTMRKLGWNAELQGQASTISVPYETEGLQKGSLLILPSAFDNTKGRMFRVIEISGVCIYPASLTCLVAPEFEDTFSSGLTNYKKSSFNLLNREED